MPRNVLVNVEDEDSVHAALQTLSYRIRPRLKPGFGRHVLGNWVKSASGGADLFRDRSEDRHGEFDEQAASDGAKDIAKGEVPEDAKAPALATNSKDAPGGYRRRVIPRREIPPGPPGPPPGPPPSTPLERYLLDLTTVTLGSPQLALSNPSLPLPPESSPSPPAPPSGDGGEGSV